MKIFVTGAAGFIGFHLCKKLLKSNIKFIGIDNFNSYYDPNLKKARVNELEKIAILNKSKIKIVNGDICNKDNLKKIFSEFKPSVVVNLAAQAGVRYSIENPDAYINSNLIGFSNILESCRINKVKHLVYASSSSVYGGNTKMPFSETNNADHPVSLYAATKRSNELMAHSYSHLYSIPATGLRFFTVYGPWGRPDMALFLFTKSILNGEEIKVFNHGKMIRDFTYIDDIIESILKVINKPPEEDKTYNKNNPNPSASWAPHRIFNIGNSKPTSLINYINAIEDALNMKAKKTFLPMQPGDVAATSSDCSLLKNWINYKPNTPIKDGIHEFINWYKNFYKI